MIEQGRFYRAGMMKDINPRGPESNVPYYIKIEDGTIVPEGAVVEEGEFAIAVDETKFDSKKKGNTEENREPAKCYYIKATDEVKAHIDQMMKNAAADIARVLKQRIREYREKGLDYFEELEKHTDPLNAETMKAEKVKTETEEQIKQQEAIVLDRKKKYDAALIKLEKLKEKKAELENLEINKADPR